MTIYDTDLQKAADLLSEQNRQLARLIARAAARRVAWAFVEASKEAGVEQFRKAKLLAAQVAPDNIDCP